jgi:hypothetical protein
VIVAGGGENRLLACWSGFGHQRDFTFFVAGGRIVAMQQFTIALQ